MGNSPGTVKRDIQKAERLFTILNLLKERETITSNELADYCNTTQRTIYRDMALLEEVGVHYVTEGKSGYRLIDSPVTPNRKLSQQEWLALTVYPLITNDFLHNEHPVHHAYKTGIEKMKGLSKDTTSAPLLAVSEELGDRIRFHDQVGNKDKNHVMPQLFQAIIENRAIEIEYYAIYNDTTAKRIIHPYYVLPRSGHLYVLAYCTMREGYRTFRLNRFLSVTLQEETFEIDKTFDVDTYLENRWTIIAEDEEETTFMVRFDPNIARYVDEFTFYTETSVTKEADGAVVLKATVKSRKEFLRWVRGFGLDAEVLEPQDIRDEIHNEYKIQMSRYRKS
ncbi:helix-turn-helix transcriptional regulator [Alkalicoccobacillus porphyridii]|uniref:YafY family transcriptional regulator n=1 Tax=Alkalicoccobacillus porphyridii TaxID=2597270 RepID=A0A554A1Y1_9BACI|nr:YafY family protein [Alkalicoccobacillus porphyridii]TSB47701.1 YafY family transcriptional regulator [Alkalicoccobacillus porphyridii]